MSLLAHPKALRNRDPRPNSAPPAARSHDLRPNSGPPAARSRAPRPGPAAHLKAVLLAALFATACSASPPAPASVLEAYLPGARLPNGYRLEAVIARPYRGARLRGSGPELAIDRVLPEQRLAWYANRARHVHSGPWQPLSLPGSQLKAYRADEALMVPFWAPDGSYCRVEASYSDPAPLLELLQGVGLPQTGVPLEEVDPAAIRALLQEALPGSELPSAWQPRLGWKAEGVTEAWFSREGDWLLVRRQGKDSPVKQSLREVAFHRVVGGGELSATLVERPLPALELLLGEPEVHVTARPGSDPESVTLTIQGDQPPSLARPVSPQAFQRVLASERASSEPRGLALALQRQAPGGDVVEVWVGTPRIPSGPVNPDRLGGPEQSPKGPPEQSPKRPLEEALSEPLAGLRLPP